MDRKKNRTIISILDFEDELKGLCRNLDDPTLTKKAAAAVEARIKAICVQLYPDDPEGRERFRSLAMNWQRSSGYAVDYAIERSYLIERQAEEAARKQREHLKKINSQRWDQNSRNIQMAEEFRKRIKTSDLSDSALKAQIGRKRHVLGRSASIDAINRGLDLLDAQKVDGDHKGTGN